MSSEILRRAAADIREKVIHVTADGDLTEWYDAEEMAAILRRSEPEHSRLDRDAEFIASWPPLVALAVANLLEDEADAIDVQRRITPGYSPGTDDKTVVLARAYLGPDA